MFPDFQNKRIFITGHTGFKGSWLCQWLLTLGANIKGYALDLPTNPSLFESLGLSEQLLDVRADIRDKKRLTSELIDFQPDLVFHLAAQPLVRYSYAYPLETYESNVMGTIYLLDALRQLTNPCAAVMVTSDKCYENREWVYGYREEDPMGGSDPYSSSKGMAELAISAYRRSYFQNSPIRIASARAGNVIGGGDWAPDRIIPDCIRACQQQTSIEVRNPYATRPWQHVLDPLSGYLQLGSKLLEVEKESDQQTQFDEGFNFGPSNESNRTVREVVTALFEHLPGKWVDKSTTKAPHEARFLHLSTDKANKLLNWQSKWNFGESIRRTAEWYHCYISGGDVRSLTQQQIDSFVG